MYNNIKNKNRKRRKEYSFIELLTYVLLGKEIETQSQKGHTPSMIKRTDINYREHRGRNQRRRRRRRIKNLAILSVLLLSIGGLAVILTKEFKLVAQESEKTSIIAAFAENKIPKQEDIIGNMENNVSDGDVQQPEEEINLDDGISIIAIDAGHGGVDGGTSSGDVLEKTINLQLAQLLKSKLEEMGYTIFLTRDQDDYMTLEERVEASKKARADIYISIHQNACEEEASGMETWYCGQDGWDKSKKLAQLIHQEVIGKTQARDRGLQDTSELYVIRESGVPSCLIETGFLSDATDRANLQSSEYQQKIVDGIAQGIDLYFHPKTMYLTFDDGPSEENTGRILDILKERGIKATFFVVGENVRKHPEVAKRIVEEGHTLGIHCNHHKYEEIYASVDSYLADFEAAYQAVYEVTGVEVKLFRFPGGSINSYNKTVYEDIIKEMTDRGYIYFDWNASLEDAVQKVEPEQLLVNAKQTALGRNKVVMLAHDIVYNTSLCLDGLIDQFPEYQMQPLTPEVAPVQFGNK